MLIVDTAGRLSIDAEMMEQVRLISGAVDPDYTFLVIDAMTGQDAVQTAEAFHETLQIDGVIMSKMDGDARGGAALSVKEVIGDRSPSRPPARSSTSSSSSTPTVWRAASSAWATCSHSSSRPKQAFEQHEAEEAAQKMMDGQFTLDDFLDQMQQIKKMGSLGSIMSMMPGIPKELKNANIDDDDLKPIEAIIRSMTMEERTFPKVINGSRRQRIAAGSGTQVGDVNRLVKQFDEMQKMMKKMGVIGGAGGGKGKKGKKGKGGTKRPKGLPPGFDSERRHGHPRAARRAGHARDPRAAALTIDPNPLRYPLGTVTQVIERHRWSGTGARPRTLWWRRSVAAQRDRSSRIGDGHRAAATTSGCPFGDFSVPRCCVPVNGSAWRTSRS